VRKFLLGARGTTVKVTVERQATKQSETVNIVRDAVSLPSIAQAYMLRPGVGYVGMTGGFNLTTADEFEIALKELHGKGMNMLVLDLRGNRGGLLIQAVRVANTFLQHGQMIVSQKGRFRDSSQSYAAVNENPDAFRLSCWLTAIRRLRLKSLPVRCRITIALSSSAKRRSAKVSYSFHSSWTTTRLCC
jgi:C-terminal processing protease CtpA/Prc